MSRAFIGCGANLRRLVLEIFDKDDELATDMPGLAVNYCLIRARAVDVPALESRAKACGERLDAAVPGLTERLEDALISGARSESTKESKDHALHVAEILRDAGVDMPSDAMKGNEGTEMLSLTPSRRRLPSRSKPAKRPSPSRWSGIRRDAPGMTAGTATVCLRSLRPTTSMRRARRRVCSMPACARSCRPSP